MKGIAEMRTKSFLIPVVLSLFLLGCEQSEISQTKLFFEDKHLLQRLVQHDSQEGSLSGGGLFIFGTGVMVINGKTETKQFVKFAWESSVKDTFIISSILLEKARVRLENDINVPTVEFIFNRTMPIKTWFGRDGDFYLKANGQQEVINLGYIDYVIFTVKPSDWSPKIKMPL